MNLTTLADLSAGQLHELLLTARDLHRHPTGYMDACRGQTVVLIAMEPAFHVRLAVEVGFGELGGTVLTYTEPELGERWSTRPSELARTLSASADGILSIAVEDIQERLVMGSRVPVVAVCSGTHSIVDALAMLMSVVRTRGSLEGKRLACIGDGAAVAHGCLLAGALAGMTVAVSHPRGFAPDPNVVTQARDVASRNNGAILITEDPAQAMTDADVVVVDAWSARGGDRDPVLRAEHFADHTLSVELLQRARPGALVLHPGPVNIPAEIAPDVVDAGRLDPVEWPNNRVHVAKAILLHTFGRGR